MCRIEAFVCNLDLSCGFFPVFFLLHTVLPEHCCIIITNSIIISPKNETKNVLAHIFSKITTYFMKLLFNEIDSVLLKKIYFSFVR